MLFSSSHIKDTDYGYDLSLLTLTVTTCLRCPSSFSAVKLLSPWRPVFYTIFGSKSLCSPHLSCVELFFIFWRAEYLNYWGIFCMGYLFSSMYLFSHLFTPVWTRRYFIIWVTFQYYFAFLLNFFQLWPSEAFSVDSCVPSLCVCVCVFSLLYLLVFQDAPGSSCKSSALVLE